MFFLAMTAQTDRSSLFVVLILVSLWAAVVVGAHYVSKDIPLHASAPEQEEILHVQE